MKEYRSASQILFGFLPDQTVDLKGGVWKIDKWRRPVRESAIDNRTMRTELIRQAWPWAENGRDGGFVKDLERNRPFQVYSLDRENGVQAEQFPRLWECRSCHRLYGDQDFHCPCGSTGRPGQIHFVGYCEECGAIKAPYVPKCDQHKQRRINWPGTATATEILFDCPKCKKQLKKGLGSPNCHCGNGRIKFAVHRAASVYTPRSIVIVNPPSQQKIREISEAGGPPKALAWVVNGMQSMTVADAPNTTEAVRRQLEQTGLPTEQIEVMLATLDTNQDADYLIPGDLEEQADAEQQAVSIALACSESRISFEDLLRLCEERPQLKDLYEKKYRKSFADAGIASVDMLDRFPILTGMFGYTRGSPEPGRSRLVPFRIENKYAVLADPAETEALFFRLSPRRVARWLVGQGFQIDEGVNESEWRYNILKAACRGDENSGELKHALLMLTHSYCHRTIRLAAVYGGIDENGLSELVVPLHLGFFVYAAARGDFVLGGLQALFESELDQMLRVIRADDHRCPLDPGCLQGGGACMACLHLGEPSCRHYNSALSRTVLIGANGYLSPDFD
ncbi:MAG: hypothetical protein OEQ39_17570 [Gammaproteobacteria bacterium]|nr:hypothetical protein [Gammaproteobacteria bacterium]